MAEKLLALGLLSILITTLSAQQSSTSLEDLIKNIFNTNENGENDPNAQANVTPTPGVFQPTPTKVTVLDPGPAPGPEPVPVPLPTPNVTPGKSCGLQKECVKRFLCKNEQIIKDGTGLIDIRIDGTECSYLEECCFIPDKVTDPIIPIHPPEQHEGCGYPNHDGVGFKITGDEDNEAQFGEFPWMVAVLREEQAGEEILNLYECGGALIAPNVIITATHCVITRKAESLVVRAGEWDTQTKNEILPHQDRRVKEIIVHEQYNKGSLYNDIALLILESPLVYEENVRPICLPEPNTNFDLSRCYATGWGKNKFGKEGSYQVILKKIDMPIVPHAKCQQNLRNTRLGKYFELHDSFICAGGEKNKDTCKGDGGSPLVCPLNGVANRYYQAGIVAWGIGCGELNVPGVYASVPYLRQWIDEKLTARGIDFRHFTP